MKSDKSYIFCIEKKKLLKKCNLSNYATKRDLKNEADVDISTFAKKTDLVNLKSNVNKLDIDKLENVPVILSNLKSKVPIILSNLKSKVVKLDVHKLVPVPTCT